MTEETTRSLAKRVAKPINLNSGATYRFWYTNWKGKRGYYTVTVNHFWCGSNEYHKEYQLLMNAFVPNKQEYRDFAVNKIEWETVDRIEG